MAFMKKLKFSLSYKNVVQHREQFFSLSFTAPRELSSELLSNYTYFSFSFQFPNKLAQFYHLKGEG